MGQVISCIKPDPQYESSAPVVRTKGRASELRRPTTARSQREFQRRAIESIRVSQPPSTEPNMARVEMVESLADDDDIGKRSTLDVGNDVPSKPQDQDVATKKPKKLTRFADDVIARTTSVNSPSINADDASNAPEAQTVGDSADSDTLPSPSDSKADVNIQPESTIEISISSNPTVDAPSSDTDDASAKNEDSHIVPGEDDAENPPPSEDSNATMDTADSTANNGTCGADLSIEAHEAGSKPTDTILKESALSSLPTPEPGDSQIDTISPHQSSLSIPNEQVPEDVNENSTFVEVSPLSTPDRSEDSPKTIDLKEEMIGHVKEEKDAAPQPSSLDTQSVRTRLLSMPSNRRWNEGSESRLLSVREGIEMFDPLQQTFEVSQLFNRATLGDKDMVFEAPESLTSEELDHIGDFGPELLPLR